VAPKSQAAEDLRSLFEEQLKDIYWAEKALTKALPKMAKNATSPELVDALNEHLEVTRSQVQRVEEVFGMIGKKAQAKKCDAMEGLIKEGESILEDTQPGAVRDAGIIGACQKVEHYEIATYGTLASFATLLGEDEAAATLHEILAEEKEADETLTGVAESAINIDAMEEEEEEDDDSDVMVQKKTTTRKSTAKK
jgi:ferritin-like metal-binding protein YciE